MTGHSVFKPLSRLFTDERGRDVAELQRLHEWVQTNQARFSLSPEALVDPILPLIRGHTDEVRRAFYTAIGGFYAAELYFAPLLPRDVHRMNMLECIEYRNELAARQYFLVNQIAIVELFKEGIQHLIGGIAEFLPKTANPSPFTIPLIFAIERPIDLLEGLWGFFQQDDYLDRGLFKGVSKQLYLNACTVSGLAPEEAKPTSRWKMMRDSTLPLNERVAAYFGRTPLAELLLSPVPLKLTYEERFSHWHILGGSGSGKTTLIENLVRHDLESDDPPSLVILDPHSDLIRKLARSDLGIEDRLILLDPRDTAFPIALNPFATNRNRFNSYDEATQEQVTAGVIQTLSYFWNGLTSLHLTGKQDVFAKYVIRLLLTLPDAGVLENGEIVYRNATIIDMLKLMKDPKPYAHAISQLPDVQREFFETDFEAKTFDQTKEQVRYRIQAIIENPTMARLFTSPETKVDFYKAMNEGAVILVDTAKDFLKDGSAIFGKLILSLVLQAVMERAAIPANQRKPTFIIVDEASSVFSTNIDDLLSEARKYKAGLVLSHQYMDQATSSLKASLAANAAIKFAAGISASDAGTMAREMRCSPDTILDQPRLHFAAHIRNVTPSAVSIPIRFVRDAPMLPPNRFDELVAENRARVSLASQRAGQAEPGTSEASDPDASVSHRSPGASKNFGDKHAGSSPAEDISPEW